MTQRERERIARQHLYQYAKDKRELEEYARKVFAAPRHDETGIRGSVTADPTANAGIALADPPKHLQRKQKWIAAIDDAIHELIQTDDGDERGFTYICTRIYGLDGKRHSRRKNRDTALKIADDCNMSVRSLYYRLGIIVNVVIAHAVEHECFEDK